MCFSWQELIALGGLLVVLVLVQILFIQRLYLRIERLNSDTQKGLLGLHSIFQDMNLIFFNVHTALMERVSKGQVTGMSYKQALMVMKAELEAKNKTTPHPFLYRLIRTLDDLEKVEHGEISI